MNVAIIHDHLLAFGGAERVLITLLKLYPKADLYTAFATHDNLEIFKKRTLGKISVSPLNTIPFSHQIADWFKPLVYFYWESLDLTSYDLVVSSSHSFSSKSVITQPHTLHISYIYTPPRYLYTEFNETQIIRKPPLNVLLSPLLTWLRMEDYLGAQRPDVMIASSKLIKRRINKYYKRDSVVIYPPVSIPPQHSSIRKEYFLVFSRLVKQKGIDLAIRTCNTMKLPLLVVGEGSEENYLKSIAGPSISFKGFVQDDELPEIFVRARALIYCSREEDFGLVPVEAMAYGVPVIAYKSGAIIETIIDRKTGILFNNYSVINLQDAILTFFKLKLNAADCRNQARKFTDSVFQKQFKNVIDKGFSQLLRA